MSSEPLLLFPCFWKVFLGYDRYSWSQICRKQVRTFFFNFTIFFNNLFHVFFFFFEVIIHVVCVRACARKWTCDTFSAQSEISTIISTKFIHLRGLQWNTLLYLQYLMWSRSSTKITFNNHFINERNMKITTVLSEISNDYK